MLVAGLVHPHRQEVFPLGGEPIVKQDGTTKNDCERNAVRRLLPWLKAQYPDMSFLVVEDALYANGPHLKEILENGWQFIVNVKPKGNSSLFKAYEARCERKNVEEMIHTEDGYTYHYRFTNNLPLNSSHPDLRVNFIHLTLTSPKGKKTEFTWITSIKVSRGNVVKLVRAARARWKIENETFNTLKNQGYHFKHNYGHGFQHLATNFAYLMLAAFFVDQIIQACCELFRALRQALRSKTKLWEVFRAAFMVHKLKSFKELYQYIAHENYVQLE
jgi:hypothetical protein